MKYFLTIALMCLMSLAAFAQQEFSIEGTIKGLEDGIIMNLRRDEGRLMVVIATDTVKNETFHFKLAPIGDASECLMLDSRGNGFPNTWVDVWVVPGAQVKISGHNKLIRTWHIDSSVKEQQELNKYVDATRNLQGERLKRTTQINELFNIIRESSGVGKAEAIEKKNQLRAEEDSINQLITRKKIEIMKQSPAGSIIWMKQLREMSFGCRYQEDYPFRKEAIAFYSQLNQKQKESEAGKEITINIFPPVAVKVGDIMADADLYDLKGTLHHLSEFKGKLILLDFWSRGCGPCIMSIPELKEVSEKYKENLHVVSISQDNNKNWTAASKQHGITWNNLNDLQGANGISIKYDVRGIPFYVLISPEGVILKTWGGYAKGSIINNLKKLFEQMQHTTTVQKVGTCIVINEPIEKSSNTSLLIKKVELTDAATILHAKIFCNHGEWVRISPATYLKTNGEKKFKLVSAKGITPGKEFFPPESGEAEIELTFAPLPKDTKSFDFQEGTASNDWSIEGIALSENK